MSHGPWRDIFFNMNSLDGFIPVSKFLFNAAISQFRLVNSTLRREITLAVAAMRALACMTFIVLCTPCLSGEMKRVPASKAHCANWDGYCYEWFFARDTSLRFIAHGFEDGGNWVFYRRSSKGAYRKMFAVHPAMLDAKHPGDLFWGYASDIKDVVLAPSRDRLMLQVAFNHEYEYDGNVTAPKGQYVIPFVLFRGTTTQPSMKVDTGLRFVPFTTSHAESRARTKHRVR